MKFVTPDAMREAEGRAILQNPSLSNRMMDYAGKGLADAIASIARRADLFDPSVLLLAGPGNNGGDAFAAAVCLLEMGLIPEVWLTCPPEKLRGTARDFFEEMEALEIPWEDMSTEEAWTQISVERLPPPILVDALLGTGAKGELTGCIRCACDYLRQHQERCLIVSADLPTGMDGVTGAVAEGAVQADVTVTMGFPKVGVATPSALESLGSLWRVQIGLPDEAADAMPDARPDLQWISGKETHAALPDRRRLTHKGVYGRALVMGGSWQYPGAIVLATEGAARSGVGIVRVATVERALPALVSRVPEAIAAADLDAEFPLDGMKGILLGPGLGRTPEARRLVARLLRETPCPLVLDADGISVLEGKPEAVQACEQPVILTPHPGELSLLMGIPIAEIQSDRLAAVRDAAKRTGAIVVLKGAGTLVAKEGAATFLNLNGNPGMACGGSGDVLAGLLVGLLAQGMEPYAAAQAAVWIHGAAGDVAALRKTQPAMKAGDIADELPAAFQRLLLA
jgi:ADP-dependent NAD(P)H-hydrate dehydratase / NAD(P)H-hydrate epimerase